MEKYKILDLFSGLGGFSLGLERTGHFETVAFCDNNQYSKLILDKHWKGVKIYDDVREISKEKFREDGIEFPDIITGGFPCQPFSVAGKQKGTSDDRHLWPEMFRIIKAFKPRYVIGENVRGIVNIQEGVVFETVCTDLESEGYEVQPFIIPAAGVGAPHRRERVWIIANREESMVNSDNIRFQQHSTTKEESSWRGTSATFESTSNVSNAKSERTGQNDEGLWQRSSRISGGQGTSAAESPRSNVANTIGNDERREISRSDEEERRIQEEYRTEHSTTRKSSRTSEVRNGDNGYETTESNVADTEGLRFRGRSGEERGIKKNEFQQTEQKGSSFRSETERRSSQSGGDDVADTHSSNQRTGKKSKQQEGNTSRECFSNSSEYVADTESIGSNVRERREHQEERQGQQQTRGEGGETMVDSSTGRCTSQETEVQPGRYSSFDSSWWQSEPELGRVAHGVPGRVHRLKALGNSIVPQIAEEIGKAIIQAEKE